MNDLPRQKLREIVARHGRAAIIGEPRRCEGLLRDYCGGHRREVSVLVSALEEGVAADMLNFRAGTPREVLLARLTQRLCDHLALTEPAARWAVDSWALALDVISNDELEAIERRRAEQTEAPTMPVPATSAPAPSKTRAQMRPAATSAAASVTVSADGVGDYTDIGGALKDVAPGGRLIIRPGVYDESIVIDRPVEIIGDGPAEEIVIRGVNSSCIRVLAERATVRGLTLRGRAVAGRTGFFAVDIPRGNLVLEDCDISSDTLSCVAVHGPAAAPLIRRCRIHGGSDSGIYFFDGAAGTVEECEVYGNANVGVAITARAKPVVRHSRIYDGKDAGVVVWQEGLGLIEACEVYGNRLAGIGISEGGNPTVRACRLYEGNNSGVFVHHGGAGTVEECDIYGHRRAEVAITTWANLIMRRCRIRNGRDCGVFMQEEGQALLEECGIYENAESGVVVGMGAVAAIRGCHINRNSQVAVKAFDGSTLSVEDSDLASNVLGPWDVREGASVEQARNRW